MTRATGARGGPGRPRHTDGLVSIGEVTKRYVGTGPPALDGVSLEVAEGEAVAVMGPSGSGKSTLLNLIAGLDKPTSSTVTVAGQWVDALGETRVARFRRRHIGMIFQFFNLLDDLTVADNVLLPAQLAGVRRSRARVQAGELLAAATAAATLGLSLLTNSNEAFTNGFAAHHGADISVTVDPSPGHRRDHRADPPGVHPAAQMLYTFTKAGTALQIAADVSALKAALPAGAVISYDSWLSSAGQTGSEQSVNTPFVLAFALIGLVLAVLIVATLVSGAVVAGYRRIGVLKSIGFTPWAAVSRTTTALHAE